MVNLDKHFMGRVPGKHIKHSRELKLRKKLAIKQETISLLMEALRFAPEKSERLSMKFITTAPVLIKITPKQLGAKT